MRLCFPSVDSSHSAWISLHSFSQFLCYCILMALIQEWCLAELFSMDLILLAARLLWTALGIADYFLWPHCMQCQDNSGSLWAPTQSQCALVPRPSHLAAALEIQSRTLTEIVELQERRRIISMKLFHQI